MVWLILLACKIEVLINLADYSLFFLSDEEILITGVENSDDRRDNLIGKKRTLVSSSNQEHMNLQN